MSKKADAARELRWKVGGGARLTSRVSGKAHDALVLLAVHHGLDQRQVLENLLLAAEAVLLRDGESALIATMRDHRMSRTEAELFRAMVDAQVSPGVRA